MTELLDELNARLEQLNTEYNTSFIDSEQDILFGRISELEDIIDIIESK